MPGSPSALTRSQQYRRRQIGRGLREVRLWVADTRKPEFVTAADREGKTLHGRTDEAEALAFMEAAFDWPEE